MAIDKNIESKPTDNSKENDSSSAKVRQKKTTPKKKDVEIIPLLLIVVFGIAIFFMLKQFDANKSLINLFLMNFIAIFVGFCCWFFIGRVQGNEFTIFGFKIKTITGSFFVYLFVFVMGILFFNPSDPKPVVVYDEKIIKGLSEYSGLNLKLKIDPTKNNANFNLETFVDVSKYITSISSSPALTKPQQLDLTFQFPDSIGKSESKILLYVDDYTYQKLVNPSSKTVPLSLISGWGEFTEIGIHIFKHPFQNTLPVSLIIWK